MMSRSISRFTSRFVATLLVAIIATSPIYGCSLSSDQESGSDSDALSGMTLMDQVKKGCGGYARRPFGPTATERLIEQRLCEDGADIAYQSVETNKEPTGEAVRAFQEMLEWSSETNKLSPALVNDASNKETQALIARAAQKGLFTKNLSWSHWQVLDQVKKGEVSGGFRYFVAETGLLEDVASNESSASEVAAAHHALTSAEVAGLGLTSWRRLVVLALALIPVVLLVAACSEATPIEPNDLPPVSTPEPGIGTKTMWRATTDGPALFTTLGSLGFPEAGIGLHLVINDVTVLGITNADNFTLSGVFTLGDYQLVYEERGWKFDAAPGGLDAQWLWGRSFRVYEGVMDANHLFQPHTQLAEVALLLSSDTSADYNLAQGFGLSEDGEGGINEYRVWQDLIGAATDCTPIIEYLEAQDLAQGARQLPVATLPDGRPAQFVSTPVCVDQDEVLVGETDADMASTNPTIDTCFEFSIVRPGLDQSAQNAHVGVVNLGGAMAESGTTVVTSGKTTATFLDGSGGQAATVPIRDAADVNDSTYTVCLPAGTDLSQYAVVVDQAGLTYGSAPDASCEGATPLQFGDNCASLRDVAEGIGTAVTVIRVLGWLVGAPN